MNTEIKEQNLTYGTYTVPKNAFVKLVSTGKVMIIEPRFKRGDLVIFNESPYLIKDIEDNIRYKLIDKFGDTLSVGFMTPLLSTTFEEVTRFVTSERKEQLKNAIEELTKNQ